MKVTRLLWILMVSLLGVYDSSAQQDSVMRFSLTEAQNYAVENFYVSKNAKLDVEAARNLVLQNTALGLPQLKATADFQYIPNPPSFPFPDFNNPDGPPMEVYLALEKNLTYGATVSQLIFSGEYIVGLQAARVYKILSQESYEKTVIDVKENVAGTYYGILILKSNREILIKTLENLRMNLDQMKKTYEAGLIEDTEVDQLDLTVKRTENSLTTLDNQLATLYKLFEYQLGLQAETQIELTENIDNLVSNNLISGSQYNFNLDENIDYQLLATQEKLQKLNYNRYKSQYLPTVTGFYNYSDQTKSSEFSQPIHHVFGIQASWPIFQSGVHYAQVSQARIEYEKAANMRIQESERLTLAAEQARFDYQTAVNKYMNEKKNFELSEKVFEKTTEKYKLGVVSSLELSLVNTQYLQAQMSYASAIHELLVSKVKLDKAFNKL